MLKILRYTLLDLLRNRIIIGYAALLGLLTTSLFALDNEPERGLLSLVSVVLWLVPLVCLVFSSIHYYNASEFTELLLVQPIHRRSILLGQLLALVLALVLAFLVGVALPLLLAYPSIKSAMLLGVGVALTSIFTILSYLITLYNRDKARGIGFSILVWLYFAIIYDGLLLLFVFLLSNYPIEGWVLPLASLNPVDLGRILILLQLDLSAMMGYTGAVYKQFFGSAQGMLYTSLWLLAWAAIPLLLALRRFAHKDF